MNESEFATLARSASGDLPPSSAPTAEVLEAARRSYRRRRSLLLVGLAAATMVVAGLIGVAMPPVDHDDDKPAAPTTARSLSGAWKLISGQVDGQELDVQADYPVTFVVEQRGGKLTVGGQSACNYYGSDLTVDGPNLRVSGGESTLMGCADPVQTLETGYQQGLLDVTAYEQTETRLTLTGPSVELLFEPLPVTPTAQLVDTEWKLETIVNEDSSSSVVGDASLLLRSDGTFHMSSGCGLVLTGEWVEWNGAITFTSSSASGGCQQNPQSQAILAASDSIYVAIDGDQLTVTGRHGGELLYRRTP